MIAYVFYPLLTWCQLIGFFMRVWLLSVCHEERRETGKNTATLVFLRIELILCMLPILFPIFETEEFLFN